MDHVNIELNGALTLNWHSTITPNIAIVAINGLSDQTISFPPLKKPFHPNDWSLASVTHDPDLPSELFQMRDLAGTPTIALCQERWPLIIMPCLGFVIMGNVTCLRCIDPPWAEIKQAPQSRWLTKCYKKQDGMTTRRKYSTISLLRWERTSLKYWNHQLVVWKEIVAALRFSRFKCLILDWISWACKTLVFANF